MARPSFDPAAWRERVACLPSLIPLANCSHAPLLEPVRAALDAYADSWARGVMDWDAWMDEVDRGKRAFARLIHATPQEIAVLPSVTAAAAVVASALEPAGRRRRVLLSEAEFPTVGHVWLGRARAGFELDWVPLEGPQGEIVSAASWEDRIDDRTLLVSATHAYFVNGAIQDVRAITERAHAAGAGVFVDAYQTAGIVPVDVRELEVDFLAAGCHKFLLGVPGIAYLYVRRERIAELEPALTGWFGREDIFAFDPKRLDWAASARRFELSTPPVPAAYAARAGLDVILDLGVPAIHRHAAGLATRIVEGARHRGLVVHGASAVSRTPTTAIVCDSDSSAIEESLRERGVRAAARGPVIRLAPHFFNTADDIDLALDALASLLGAP